jgi:hypothetical protein
VPGDPGVDYSKYLHVAMRPEPTGNARERLVRVISDCRPPYPAQLSVKLNYDRGLTQMLGILAQPGSPPDVGLALEKCIKIRSEQLGAVGELQQNFDVDVSYMVGSPTFPFPIPTPSGPPLALGECDDAILKKVGDRLTAAGYKTWHFRFLDGVALATTPEQLDSDGAPLVGPARFAALKASCWEQYGWFGGIFSSCFAFPPSERVRTFSFFCSSATGLATWDYAGPDPAAAMQSLIAQGSLRWVRLPDAAPRNMHLAVYRYTRAPGDSNFKLESGVNVSSEVPIRVDSW